jgi:hypothetical protein
VKCLSLFSTPCFEQWEFYGRQSVPYTLSGVPDMCMTVPFIISHVNIRTSFRAKQKQTLEFSTCPVCLTAQTLSLYSRFKLSHFHTRVVCVLLVSWIILACTSSFLLKECARWMVFLQASYNNGTMLSQESKHDITHCKTLEQGRTV